MKSQRLVWLLTTTLFLLSCNAESSSNTTEDTGGVEDTSVREDLQPDTAPPEPGSVTGFAFLAGASDHSGITVQLSSALTTTTDASGAYAVADVPPGFYSVTASLAGFQGDASSPFRVVSGEATQAPSMTLDLATGTVEGTARFDDGTTGGIGILIDGTSRSAFADSAGRWSIDNIPVGNYTVRAVARGYDDATATDQTVDADAITTVPELVLTTTPGTLVGKVKREMETDHSAIAVTVNSTSYTGATDASGNFTITGIAPGIYSVSAASDGFERFDFPPVVIEANAPTMLEDAVLTRKKGLVRGSVELVDLPTNGGALVELGSTTHTTFSLPDGSYELLVPVGNYDGVSARREGFTDAEDTTTVTVTESGVATVPPLLLYGIANDITGEVTLEGETDYTGIMVEALGVPGSATDGVLESATSASDGSFTLPGLPLGRYVVRYSYTLGWEVVTRDVRLLPGLPLTMPNLELRTCFVSINNDAAFTTSPDVILSLNCGDCFEMQVSNLSDFSDASWESCALSKDWTLSGPDGENRVYARFKDNTQTVGNALSDTVTLDASATIASVTENTAGVAKRRNDVIHFALDGGEPGGTATVNIVGFASQIALFDDGTGGDAAAGDGFYEVDYVLDSRADVNDAVVTGSFTDEAGNVATPVDAVTLVTVANPPLIFNIRVVPNNVAGEATISFETDEPTTAVLDWGGTPPAFANQETDPAFGTSHSFTFGSGALLPSTEYFYRIIATDQAGNRTITSNDSFYLVPNPPSNIVALPGDGRFDLKWDAPAQDNVVGYNIYRSTTSGSGFTKLNTSGVYTNDGLMFPDTTVSNTTTYYYTVSTVDELGFESAQSAEVSGTPTANNGGTDISGAIAIDTVWTTSGSPYTVTGNTLLLEGVQLTIGPGVVVQFADGIALRADGTLMAVGDAGSEVEFKALNAGQSWAGISLRNTPARGRLDLEVGRYLAGHLLYRARIQDTGTALTLDGNITAMIRSSITASGKGIHLTSSSFSRATLFIADSTFDGLSGNAIQAFEANRIVIHRGTFQNMQSAAVSTRFVYVEVFDSVFSQNWLGLALEGSSGSVRYRIIGNQFDGQQGGAMSFGDNSRSAIVGNRFENATGYGGTLILNQAAGSKTAYISNVFKNNQGTGSAFTAPYEGRVSQVAARNSDALFLANTFEDSPNTDRAFISTFDNTWRWNHFGVPASDDDVLRIMPRQGSSAVIEHNSFLGEANNCHINIEYPDTTGVQAAPDNYWGTAATSEMDTFGANADITPICDFYDDVSVGRVDYAPWAPSAYPMAEIDSALFGRRFAPGETVTFSGSAVDPEDGAIADANLSWSSSRDGVLGTGSSLSLNTLTPGHHQIWLSATDSGVQEGKVYTELEICPKGWADCDGDPVNGCEIETAASGSSCGLCGYACSSGQLCVDGLCTTQ